MALTEEQKKFLIKNRVPLMRAYAFSTQTGIPVKKVLPLFFPRAQIRKILPTLAGRYFKKAIEDKNLTFNLPFYLTTPPVVYDLISTFSRLPRLPTPLAVFAYIPEYTRMAEEIAAQLPFSSPEFQAANAMRASRYYSSSVPYRLQQNIWDIGAVGTLARLLPRAARLRLFSVAPGVGATAPAELLGALGAVPLIAGTYLVGETARTKAYLQHAANLIREREAKGLARFMATPMNPIATLASALALSPGERGYEAARIRAARLLWSLPPEKREMWFNIYRKMARKAEELKGKPVTLISKRKPGQFVSELQQAIRNNIVYLTKKLGRVKGAEREKILRLIQRRQAQLAKLEQQSKERPETVKNLYEKQKFNPDVALRKGFTGE